LIESVSAYQQRGTGGRSQIQRRTKSEPSAQIGINKIEENIRNKFFMAKKPPLKLVEPSPGLLADVPRNDLSDAGRSLWERITSDYDIQDSGGLEMLGQACVALDRAEECRALVDAEGLLITGKGGLLRENPCANIELANRSFVVRTLARLGLDTEAIKSVGGPGKRYG
jgi:hypothetical protein